MRMRNLLIVTMSSILVIFGLIGCKVDSLTRDEIAANDFPLVMIDSEVPVMASQLYHRLADSDLLEEGGFLDSSMYFDTLNAIVLDSLISYEASKVDLKEDPVLYRNFFLLFKEFYLKYLYQHLVLDSIDTDSLEIVDYYKSNPEYFTYREQVRARQLVISAEGLRKGKDSLLYKDYSMEQLDSMARKRVYDLREKIDSGAEFGNLAYDFSMHRESGKKMGELGYFFRYTYNKEFEDVAFSLPVGEISQPFKSPDGWHLVEVIDHIDSGLADLTPQIYEEARKRYLSENARSIYTDLMDSLLLASTIKFNDEALSGNIHTVPDTTWAAVINDIDTITFHRLPDYLHQYKQGVGLDSIDLGLMHDMLTYRAVEYVLMQAGDKMGFKDDPEVVKERHSIYHKYAQIFVKKKSRDLDYRPADSLIEKYYNENIDKFVIKKPLNVQHIIVDDSLFGEFLRDQALSGIEFLDLARQYYPGSEEIRVAAADLGYIGPGEMPDAFYMKAKTTPIGGISHPVKTEFGYHIIKVIDKKFNRTIDQVRPKVVEDLKKEHARIVYDEWKQGLFDRHDIVYSLEKLKRLELASKDRR